MSAEITRGDSIDVNPAVAMTGIPRRRYLVLASGLRGLCVTPAEGLGAYTEQLVVDPAHIASWSKGKAGPTLPAPRLDVSVPVTPAAASAAAAWVEPPVVLISIYDPKRELPYELARLDGDLAKEHRKEHGIARIEVADGDHVNKFSGGRKVGRCPADVLDRFLGTDRGAGCYRIQADEATVDATSPHVPSAEPQPRVRVALR